jgi:hypothetical protein
MILSDGECRCVFMLAVTLESVMWAHAGALPFSDNFYERSQRGALGGKQLMGKKRGKRKGGQCRKKGNCQIYRGSRKQELKI